MPLAHVWLGSRPPPGYIIASAIARCPELRLRRFGASGRSKAWRLTRPMSAAPRNVVLIVTSASERDPLQWGAAQKGDVCGSNVVLACRTYLRCCLICHNR